jgi:predicted RNase H-like nuclease (RuvC/YqgF family)
MGRPPIGKKAMTTAERQRRYLDKIRGDTADRSARVKELEKKLKDQRSENKISAETITKLRDRIDILEARVAQAKDVAAKTMKIDGDSATVIAKLQEELAARALQVNHLRGRIREFVNAPKGTVFMASTDRRKILAVLHPDHASDPAMKKRHEEAFKIFTKLSIS